MSSFQVFLASARVFLKPAQKSCRTFINNAFVLYEPKVELQKQSHFSLTVACYIRSRNFLAVYRFACRVAIYRLEILLKAKQSSPKGCFDRSLLFKRKIGTKAYVHLTTTSLFIDFFKLCLKIGTSTKALVLNTRPSTINRTIVCLGR